MQKVAVKPSHVIGLILVLTFAGCANFSSIEKSISQRSPHKADQIVSQRSTDLLVLVAFSGWGTRGAPGLAEIIGSIGSDQIGR